MNKKYPIGIQDFAKLREDDCYYVDKTAQIYRLANEGCYYFLSRPRRFGKSLTLSTLEYYFEGRRDLFKGLAMEQLETEWKQYPVLSISFNQATKSLEELDALFESVLFKLENRFGVAHTATNYSLRLSSVLEAAHEQRGQRVVVLVDEYDKPMLSLMEAGKDYDEARSRLKAFYSAFKDNDRHLRFVMLTGVTRFSKVSVFSDLNNLEDISMNEDYADLCGLTYEEIRDTFQAGVSRLAEKCGLTEQACYEQLRRRYDGYRFTRANVHIYNPFSVLNTLKKNEMSDYWFASGTPTFLISTIGSTDVDMAEALSKPIDETTLASVESFKTTPLPLLYQSGYLTIKDYDTEEETYLLDYPNGEVRKGFLNFLVPTYMGEPNRGVIGLRLRNMVARGQAEEMMQTIADIFETKPYTLTTNKTYERDYQNTFYLIFSLLGLSVEVELATARGRLDVTVLTNDYIYLFELKKDDTPQNALAQIRDHGYPGRFKGDPRQLFLIGVGFDTAKKGAVAYKIE